MDRELEEVRSIIYIPANSVEVELVCKVYDPDSRDLIRVSKVLGLSDVQRAIDDAKYNYIEDDDEFVLTDIGVKYAEELERKDAEQQG